MCVRLLLTVRSHSFVISALPQFSTSDSGSIFRGRIPSTEKAITISVLGKRSLMLSIMPWRKFFSTALNLVVMKKLNTCKYGKIAYGPNGPNWGWYNGPFWKPMGKWPEIPSQPHPWVHVCCKESLQTLCTSCNGTIHTCLPVESSQKSLAVIPNWWV